MQSSLPKLNLSFNAAKTLRDTAIITILLAIMCAALWFVLTTHQNLKITQQNSQTFDEMSEFTAHMLRLADHKTYYQSILRRLNASFRWEKDIHDVRNPGLSDEIEVYLFDAQGKRLPWPTAEISKVKASENYLKLLNKLSDNPDIHLSRTELSLAYLFSGNSNTVYPLTQQPETICNFQGIGLKKHGIFFKTNFSDGTTGNLIAWIDSNKIDKHRLADSAVNFMQNRAGKEYAFSRLDLNNKNHAEKQGYTTEELNLLLAANPASNFSFQNKLYAIADTTEGIRLVCSRVAPPPPPYLTLFRNILYSLVPAYILLIIWKLTFKVSFNLNIATQFSLIILVLATLGILILLSSGALYVKEKEKSLTEDYKLKATHILEKIDKNFIFSYYELQKKYRQITKELSVPNAKPKHLLSSIAPSKHNDHLTFAGYINKYNEFEFLASTNKTDNNKYIVLFNSINGQLLDLYNSERATEGDDKRKRRQRSLDSLSTAQLSSMLFNRSQFQYTIFDTEEKLSFLDLIVDDKNLAVATFFAIHEPRKLQLKYLTDSAINILKNTGLQLIAFPKNYVEKSAYFPKYSLSRAEPLWKLNDLINQTRISNHRMGVVDKEKTLAVGIPGHHLKDYNLFLLIPTRKITQGANNSNKLYYMAYASTILFLIILSYIIIKATLKPIQSLAANLKSSEREGSKSHGLSRFQFTKGQRLEGASSALMDFVARTMEFQDPRNMEYFLNPKSEISTPELEMCGRQVANNPLSKETFYYNSLENGIAYAFIVHANSSDIENTLLCGIAQTALKVMLESQTILSPGRCIKELLSYLKINHRTTFDGQVSMLYVNLKDKMGYYAATHELSLITYDGKILDHISKVSKNLENLEIDLKNINSIMMMSPMLTKAENIENLVIQLFSNEDKSKLIGEFLGATLKKEETGTIIHLEMKKKNV
jgi:hypothetical protein